MSATPTRPAETATSAEAARRARHRERLAEIGALGPKIGHDVLNMLFPVRLAASPATTPEKLQRLRPMLGESCAQMDGLARSIQLVTTDAAHDASALTDAAAIVPQMAPLMRVVLPPGPQQVHASGEGEALVALSAAELAQVVFDCCGALANAAPGVRLAAVEVRTGDGVVRVELRLESSDAGPEPSRLGWARSLVERIGGGLVTAAGLVRFELPAARRPGSAGPA